MASLLFIVSACGLIEVGGSPALSILVMMSAATLVSVAISVRLVASGLCEKRQCRRQSPAWFHERWFICVDKESPLFPL
jgi:hypothetical protein